MIEINRHEQKRKKKTYINKIERLYFFLVMIH